MGNQKTKFFGVAERSGAERSGAERSGAERSEAERSLYNFSYVPIGIERQKRSENVHFRSHCYLRCEKTSFSGGRNSKDWQDVLHNSL